MELNADLSELYKSATAPARAALIKLAVLLSGETGREQLEVVINAFKQLDALLLSETPQLEEPT